MRPSYYAIIPSEVRYDSRLKPSEKLLYGEITCLCNKTGRCWAENRYFANLYGVNKKTVSSWVSNLEKCGYIGVDIDKRGSNKRHLSIKIGTPIHKKMDTYPQKDGGIYNSKTNNKINIPVDWLIESWNNTFKDELVPSIMSIKNSRLSRVKKRWLENPNEDYFIGYFDKIKQSDFLSGKSSEWKCSFDWIMNPTNMQKILEGNYENEKDSWLNKLRNKANDR